LEKALITGAEGFIGSHLTEMLLKNNFSVTALVQYNSFSDVGWLKCIKNHKNLKIFFGDVRDPHFCKILIRDVDVVFHLAALIAIPYSYIAPDSYIDTNIKGTLNICQAAKDNGNIRVIHTSTSEVYGSSLYVPMNEIHPLQPQSPYSASKIAADAIAMSFYHSFNLPVTILRPFNTYGPRQSARAVIPSIIIQIANNIKTIKLGETTPTRDFNYVEDTCSAFLSVFNSKITIGKTLNAGSNSEISIHDLFNLINKLMNTDVDYIIKDERKRPKNSEVNRLYSDSSLIRKTTNFQPKYDLSKGLKKTIHWFCKAENLKHYNAESYNV
jgi:NAD dependent epimerase/dehydratase